MVDNSVARVSALGGHYEAGHTGAAGDGVTLKLIPDLDLWQVAAWPDTLLSVARQLAAEFGQDSASDIGMALSSDASAMLRIEPLKFWLLGKKPPEFDAGQAVVLDLSHSRTRLSVSGPKAAELLNGYLPLDLRDKSFAPGSVASTAFHHVGVTLWRTRQLDQTLHQSACYELFLPRGFALSLWELLHESAAQYGLNVE